MWGLPMWARKLRIAVLYDGAGLARLGLEQTGHECVGFELDPVKHHLSSMVGSGQSVLADVLDITPDDLHGFDAIWSSTPCQSRSNAANPNTAKNKIDRDYNDRLLQHTLELCASMPISWIENVIENGGDNSWGVRYNAAQFEPIPRQNRQRIIGGVHRLPAVYRSFMPHYRNKGFDVCPCISASMWKRYTDKTFRKSTEMSWYGRCLSVREAAYHQGFDIPDNLLKSWFHKLDGFTDRQWRAQLYEAIGNGVPTYMSRAFGEAYSKPNKGIRQAGFFDLVDKMKHKV